ncbi:molybdopterin-dependent oxidoreductase [Thiomonas sp. FB-Cd]|uniref:molybdopterin-dependent oxidoreductase n=1 Tax=Thiomonas sp. FB-Cd TaxID=1158292 RepID=UPI0004DF6AFC|nr:molybdopterin-dependent oxidoreductase [Thiomonas sp. FB-Cd]
MQRRDFLKVSAAVGSVALLGSTLEGCSQPAEWQKMMTQAPAKQSPTVCNICFWGCAASVHTRDGELWKITGQPGDPHSNGRLCTRGTGGVGAYYDPNRLVKPLLRVQRNGKQSFEPVSWDVALGFISEKLSKVAREHGADRVAALVHGPGAGHFDHLVRAFGSDSIAQPAFAQCRGPRDTGFFLTFGEGLESPEQTDMENARCIVLVGSHIGENLHNSQVQTFGDAIRNDATIITVDPRFSVAAGKSQHWLPIRPGTDIALLLAWINVILAEQLYSRDYVVRNTLGFDALAQHVAPFTPEWAYPETGVDAELIRRTARIMAAAAPATVIHPGRHSTWWGDDTQRARAMAILAGLLGIWGARGGYYLPEAVELPSYPLPAYPAPKASWRDITLKKYPLAGAAVTNVIIDNALGKDAHYKALIVYDTNLPMTMPGVREKLATASQSLELIVAIDVQPSEMTGYADVVLPECSYLERYDPLRNSPEREPCVALRAPALPPRGDSKPGWWIAKELGKRLGLERYFPWQDYSEVVDWQLKQVGSSLAEMQKIGLKKFPRRTPLYWDAGANIPWKTPSEKIELYSTLLRDSGFEPLPHYTPPRPPSDGYFHLNYGRAPQHSFSRTQNNPVLFQLMPENLVWIHPQAARRFGIDNATYVRLVNQDGVVSNPVRVRVTERTRPDSVWLVHGFGHTASGLKLAFGRGADDSALMTRVLIDPIMGGTGMRGNFVTFRKEVVS